VIGFMQGRLSALVDGRIQAFPWAEWREEFPRGARLGFGLMEWTLDADRLEENPLSTPSGQSEIRALSERHRVRVASLTGDFLMHASPLQVDGPAREERLALLGRVIGACGALKIQYLIWPLVDQGRLGGPADEDALVTLVTGRLAPVLTQHGVQLAFESDYPAPALAAFINRLPAGLAGINYDIGNSASLGYAPGEELAAYGARVVNVHIKDRLLGGGTVPLGSGAADFPAAFRGLRDAGYAGRFILQTARAADGDHAGALSRHRDFVLKVMNTL
jgi:L-ribulose-5-phosphate 3-epimerase